MLHVSFGNISSSRIFNNLCVVKFSQCSYHIIFSQCERQMGKCHWQLHKRPVSRTWRLFCHTEKNVNKDTATVIQGSLVQQLKDLSVSPRYFSYISLTEMLPKTYYLNQIAYVSCYWICISVLIPDFWEEQKSLLRLFIHKVSFSDKESLWCHLLLKCHCNLDLFFSYYPIPFHSLYSHMDWY